MTALPNQTPTAGYSGTPLPQKLGLRDGQSVAFIGLPAQLTFLADAADFAALSRYAEWREVAPIRTFDLIHAFTKSAAELVAGLPRLQAAIKPDGMIWISWPKKASKVATDITETSIREAALQLDLVDVKVAAIDAVWSGLKLVIRKDRR
jgi:hypothetical protein